VAIKLMRAGLDAEYLRRFNDERKALASLSQRNIVTMFASGEAYDRPYFVMEHLDGESLRERIRRGRIPLPEIVEITRQICDALNAAHNRGIVHRDIKPENIFLARDDDGLLVKVLDFGIATLKESEMRTVPNAILGTAAYLSPEQARGLNREEIDGRADIYALGVVVYEMLTGSLPFTASDGAGFLYMHLNITPPRPSDRTNGTDITEAIDNAVMRALAKDPNERRQTAREFSRELKEAVERIPPQPDEIDTETLTPPRKAFLSRNVLLLAIALPLLGAGAWLAASHFSPSSNSVINGNSSAGSQDNPTGGQPAAGAASGTKTQAHLPGAASSPTVSPPAPTSGPELRVELELEGKGRVSPEMSFKSGDAVRLIATPNLSGHVYIVMKGTAGPAEILYPHPRIKGSEVEVQADQRVEMPPSKSKMPWFQFDNKPGVEILYIVFAAQKGDERLQSLESAIQRNRRELNLTEEQQIIAALEELATGQQASPTVTAKKIMLRHQK
jgi:serine/threonine protein kinase